MTYICINIMYNYIYTYMLCSSYHHTRLIHIQHMQVLFTFDINIMHFGLLRHIQNGIREIVTFHCS